MGENDKRKIILAVAIVVTIVAVLLVYSVEVSGKKSLAEEQLAQKTAEVERLKEELAEVEDELYLVERERRNLLDQVFILNQELEKNQEGEP